MILLGHGGASRVGLRPGCARLGTWLVWAGIGLASPVWFGHRGARHGMAWNLAWTAWLGWSRRGTVGHRLAWNSAWLGLELRLAWLGTPLGLAWYAAWLVCAYRGTAWMVPDRRGLELGDARLVESRHRKAWNVAARGTAGRGWVRRGLSWNLERCGAVQGEFGHVPAWQGR